MVRKVIFAWLTAVVFLGCKSQDSTPLSVVDSLFDAGTIQGVLDTDEMREASGLTESINNEGLFWVHNDSGDKGRIFLIDKEAHQKATVWLADVMARDWEDIAVGPGPVKGKNYVYVGDIGDNNSKHQYKFIYRIEEPIVDWGKKSDTTITAVDCIKFQLSDSPRDAETMMIDPLTGDIYLISKREKKVNLYKLAYPQSTTEVMTAELLVPKLEFNQFEEKRISKKGEEILVNGYNGTFYNQIVSGAISKDGDEVLVKSYSSVYYWKRKEKESIGELIQRTPIRLPYEPEPQGEAIAFDVAGKGFYTLSEVRGELPQRLFFYKRK